MTGTPTRTPEGHPDEHDEPLLDVLARTLPPLVGDAALEVVRDRSLGDRLAGRPGRVRRVALATDTSTLSLEADGDRLVPQVAHVVRGVVLSRRTPDLADWLTDLGAAVAALAAARAADARAVGATLAALGVRTAAAAVDVAVDADDPAAGLRTLPARAGALLPDDAAASLARTCDLLLAALARGDAPDAVLRTATDYLPTTLRRYLALPADARDVPGPDGRTATAAVREQLALLEDAARGLRDATLADDANALAANGIFLRDRFGGSALDG